MEWHSKKWAWRRQRGPWQLHTCSCCWFEYNPKDGKSKSGDFRRTKEATFIRGLVINERECIHACSSQREIWVIFLHRSLPCCLEIGYLNGIFHIPGSAGQWAIGINPSLPPVLGLWALTAMPGFDVGPDSEIWEPVPHLKRRHFFSQAHLPRL